MRSTAAKHPHNHFYFADKKCFVKCKSGNYRRNFAGRNFKSKFHITFKVNKDIGKIEESIKHTERELEKSEIQTAKH